MKEVAAGGVVFKRNALSTEWLLITDRYGHVTIPKGKQESGETLEQTALREVEEETGIQGRIVQQIATVAYEYEDAHKGQVAKEVTYYLIEAIGGELTIQVEEINDAQWFSSAEAWLKHFQHGYQNNDAVLDNALYALNEPLGLAATIDHTLLKADATENDIRELCRQAQQHQFASVCVLPMWVAACRTNLEDAPVAVCTVVGFPLGGSTPEVLSAETQQALKDGATEIDMVLPIGALKGGQDELVQRHIKAVVEAAGTEALVKVILETSLLEAAEVVRACQLSLEAQAHFVKTSTGFGGGGATEEHVSLMRNTVGPRMGVKASGGIKTEEQALSMLKAGATRIGTSSGVQIMAGRR